MNKTQITKAHLGIDIGRVVMAPVRNGQADTSFLSGGIDRAMETPPSPGAFEGIRRLVDAVDGQAWLISKAGASVERKTRLWLDHWDFYAETGLLKDHIRFCRKRPEKADHCRALAITHFVDDRIDVLEHLRGLVLRLYLFGEQPRLKWIPHWAFHVCDWSQTTDQVLEDLANDIAD